MRVLARCPHCGHTFEIEVSQKKGRGAHYGREIEKLGFLHIKILEILEDNLQGLTKREISRILYEEGYKYSGNSISGRLSELLGAGLVEMRYGIIELFDKREKKWRPRKTPIWSITLKGLLRLAKEKEKIEKMKKRKGALARKR